MLLSPRKNGLTSLFKEVFRALDVGVHMGGGIQCPEMAISMGPMLGVTKGSFGL